MAVTRRKSAEADFELQQEGPGRKPGSTPLKRVNLMTYGRWWWALPAMTAIFAIHYVATFVGAAFSFTDYSGIGDFNWIGFENYLKIPKDEAVVSSLGNTFFLAVGSLILSNVLGLGFALGLNRGLKTRYFLRTVLFLPVVLSTVAVSYIFKFIFDLSGPMNMILGGLGLKDLQKIWLADPTWSIWIILLVVVWQSTGFAMVIYLAGLATIPQELEEAAAIDGAGTIKRFFRVTIPLLQPSIAISTTLAMIQGLKIFDQVFAMTGGGPFGATDTISTIIYNNTFAYMQFGYGSSIAMVFTLVILALALFQLYITRDRSGVNK